MDYIPYFLIFFLIFLMIITWFNSKINTLNERFEQALLEEKQMSVNRNRLFNELTHKIMAVESAIFAKK